MTTTDKIRAPKVGERVVNLSLFGLGRRGVRKEGFTDPAKRMVWVQWDDGKYEGEFLRSLVPESEYHKTAYYQMMEKK